MCKSLGWWRAAMLIGSILAGGAVLVVVGGHASASLAALDSAADSAYNDGWQAGDNGGSGFGAWTLGGAVSNGGHFVGDSATNAGGGSGNINTSGRAWGMWAQTGSLVDAIRPFTGGAMTVGQTFELDMDNGWIAPAAAVGFGLRNSSDVNRLELYFTGGQSHYTLNIGGTTSDSGIDWTGNGLHVEFTLNSGNGYSLAVTPSGGSTSTLTGTLAASDIDRVRFFNSNAAGGDSGPNYDAFYNSLSLVPEPASLTLVTLGGVSLLMRRRRK